MSALALLSLLIGIAIFVFSLPKIRSRRLAKQKSCKICGNKMGFLGGYIPSVDDPETCQDCYFTSLTAAVKKKGSDSLSQSESEGFFLLLLYPFLLAQLLVLGIGSLFLKGDYEYWSGRQWFQATLITLAVLLALYLLLSLALTFGPSQEPDPWWF